MGQWLKNVTAGEELLTVPVNNMDTALCFQAEKGEMAPSLVHFSTAAIATVPLLASVGRRIGLSPKEKSQFNTSVGPVTSAR